MSKMLAVAMIGILAAGAIGCGSDHHMPWQKSKSTSETSSMSSAQDDCAHCPGVQTARADGTCPKCGAKVKG